MSPPRLPFSNRESTPWSLIERTKTSELGMDAQCTDCLRVNSASGNLFGTGELPGCYTGSFNAVLCRLLDWATTEPASLLWLTGPARSGKSGVGRCLAAHWESEGRIAACFKPDGNVKSYVPTLARQIAHAIPELQSQIPTVVADSQEESSVQTQFENLIAKPILQLNLSPTRRRASFPILIVLDELDNRTERDLFIEAIFKASPRLRRYIKFLVVSRPESNVGDLFESTRFQNKVNVIDISAYRVHAGTVEDSEKGSGVARSLDNFDIDSLFRTILTSSQTSRIKIVQLLSVVLVCQQVDTSSLLPFNDIPTSVTQSDRFIESILDLEPSSLQSELLDLNALMNFRRKLMISERSLQDGRIVEFCHESLKDFLVDESRSGEFYVDLTASCLTVAKGLLRVLSDIESLEKYWTSGGLGLEFDAHLVYHNCLVWCYEHLMPDGDLQRKMIEYDPIDYLSSRRESISDLSAIGLFTFACRFLRRFEEIPSCTNISDRLFGHLDCYLKLELDFWVPQNPEVMQVLEECIFPDHIDWEMFRASEEVLQTDIPRWLVGEYLPYFVMWMFDKGLGYSGSTVERTVCAFFCSESRSGKYCFRQGVVE